MRCGQLIQINAQKYFYYSRCLHGWIAIRNVMLIKCINFLTRLRCVNGIWLWYPCVCLDDAWNSMKVTKGNDEWRNRTKVFASGFYFSFGFCATHMRNLIQPEFTSSVSYYMCESIDKKPKELSRAKWSIRKVFLFSTKRRRKKNSHEKSSTYFCVFAAQYYNEKCDF